MLLGIAFVGAIIWPVNTELAAVCYASVEGWSPLAVGLVCSVGQNAMYALLYVGGDAVLRSSARLRDKAERTRQRFARHLERRFLALLGTGALIGVPPASILMLVASGLRVPLLPALAVTLSLRTARFAFVAAGGTALVAQALEMLR